MDTTTQLEHAMGELRDAKETIRALVSEIHRLRSENTDLQHRLFTVIDQRKAA